MMMIPAAAATADDGDGDCGDDDDDNHARNPRYMHSSGPQEHEYRTPS